MSGQEDTSFRKACSAWQEWIGELWRAQAECQVHGKAPADMREGRRLMVDRELPDAQALQEAGHSLVRDEVVEDGLQQVRDPLLNPSLVDTPDLQGEASSLRLSSNHSLRPKL